MVEPPFSFPVRVYWEDTDAGGVVYHARYVAFMERARSEWMRALGFGQEQMRREHDMAFVVTAMRLDFLRPARLDDALQLGVALTQCRRASLVFAQSVRRDGELLVRAEVRLGALSAATFRPHAMLPALYERLKPLENTEAEP